MQLTCPTCRSGLAVPDGTTAHVRCPACRTVFSAAAGIAPPAPVLLPPVPVPTPPRPAPRPREEPKRKPRHQEPKEDDEEQDDRRDGIADAPPPTERRRRKPAERTLTPEERRQQRAIFHRGMYGARLIQISLLFYIPAVLFVPLHQIIAEVTKDEVPLVLILAGIFGLINWVLGAIGISLCLAGPPSPGHYRFGISAVIVSVVHAVLLLAVVAKTSANSDYRALDRGTAMWAQIATQYDSLSFYLAYVVYPDDIPLHRADTILSFLTGVAEMTRLILFLMTLGCLAQAAGAKELSEDCTRMAGRVTIIPALLSLGMLAYKIVVIETNAGHVGLVVYTLNYMYRGITLVAAGILGMTTRTVGDVVEVCEFPFQTSIDLSGTSEAVAFFDKD